MNKFNACSLLLIVFAFFSFVGTYYYNQKFQENDLKYAKTIVSVTSVLSFKEKETSPVMTSQGYVITEQRGMLFFLLCLVLLLIVSLVLVIFSKIQHGPNKLHFPIMFTSILLIIIIFKTTQKIGLFNVF